MSFIGKSRDIYMTLVDRFLDAVIDGHLGTGLAVTKQDLITYLDSDFEVTTGCFLSNSGIRAGQEHINHYEPLTLRMRVDVFRILPSVLKARMRAR